VRVLAADTTTPRGSLAVVAAEGVLAEARVETDQGHSRWLLPAADALLSGLGIAPATLDAFAVTVGPGSFTGLRIGLSSVQALALAAGKPCVGLPAPDVLARLAAAAGAGERPIVTLADAFRGEVYWAVYDADGTPRHSPRVGALEQALEQAPDGAAFVGDAVETARERIARARPGASFPPTDLYLAAELGRAALACLARGATVAPSALRPLYLRGADVRPSRP
jgi:tRNA threonylcarbamoyladenosine biosynthesis protein TsaB